MAGLTGASQMPPPPPPPSGSGASSLSGSVPEGSADKPAQPPGTRRFYRRRSRGACEACRGRRIRCDAMTLGVPCTNCTAFSIECTVLPGRAAKKNVKEEGEPKVRDAASREKEPELHPMQLLEQQLMQDKIDLGLYAKFMDPSYRHALVDPGKVGYIAEHSNFALLVSEDTVHYPIPGHIRDSRTKLVKLGKEEVDLLRQRGALSIPHWTFCDELIEAYFQYVAPILPIINRSRFMRQYRDPNDPPSLLLLQTVFLAGSRVTTKTNLKETGGATMPCSMTFYKRAKALYDSDYEDDRIITLQALILLGWYGEETGDVTKNVSYWNGLATTVAQGSGLHRNAEKARLLRSDKRLWKRIWWTLFTRDRSVAVALGRPVHINTDDCDVAMICEEDFLDDEDDYPAEYRPDPAHVQFFIQYVSLCKIMSLLLSHEHPTALRNNGHSSDTLTQCDRALVEWVQNCPKEVKWEPSRYNFWAALLHCAYYVTVGLRHRAYLPNLPLEEDPQERGHLHRHTYPLPFIAFQAACEVTSAAESMIQADQVQFAPAFLIYALASALNIHVYQMHSETSSIDTVSQMRIQTCMNALTKLSKIWVAARTVCTRFETILSERGFRRNSQGTLELVKRMHNAENATKGDFMSRYDLTAEDYGSNQKIPSQFHDRIQQGVRDPTTGLLAQNNSTSAPPAASAFQTMNLLSLAGTASYNTPTPPRKSSYPVSMRPDMSLNPPFDPQASIPESDVHDESQDYGHLYAQESAYAQGVSTAFVPDVTGFEPVESLQSIRQTTAGSIDQTPAVSYGGSGFETQPGFIAVDHPWSTG